MSAPSVFRYKSEARALVAGVQREKRRPGGRPPAMRHVAKVTAPDTTSEPAEAMAAAIFRHAGDTCLWDASAGTWYLWLEGAHVYTRDTTKTGALAKDFVRKTLRELGALQPSTKITDELDELKGLSATSEAHKSAVRDMDYAHVHTLLPFANGVFCAHTRTFRPGRPSDRLSLAAAVDCVPWADSPPAMKTEFENWLSNILPREPLRSTVVSAFARSLLGNTRREFMFMGPQPMSGKSTLVNLTHAAFQNLMGSIDPRKLTHAENGDNSWLVRLKGRRIAVCSEPEPHRGSKVIKLNASVVKRIVGIDCVAWKPTRGETREDRFPTMLWVVANHDVSIGEQAMADRITRLAFTETLPIRDITEVQAEIELYKQAWASYLVNALLQRED